jgi:hypothetical protein
MKKGKKKQPPVAEIVSLNEELFSLAFGNPAGELLDQRLALAVAGLEKFVCDTFTCGRFSGTCGAFGCSTFKIN